MNHQEMHENGANDFLLAELVFAHKLHVVSGF